MPTQTQKTRKAIQELGSDWIGEQPVWLGNHDGVVVSPTPGRYYARQINGQVIEVLNSRLAPPLFDLHVLVRRSRTQPGIWQIAEILQDYDSPADQGLIAAHHTQHEEEGFDRVAIDRKQVKQLSLRVSGTWTVVLFGATVVTTSGIVLIDNQELDLSSYVITAGAKFVTIQADNTGTISFIDGTVFGSPELATEADIPAPDVGKYMIGYVLFYEGQTELADNNIRVPIALSSSGGAAVWGEISGTLADQTDLQAALDLKLESVSWGDILGTLADQVDLQAELDLKLEDAPSDGETYGRKDGAWEAVATGGSELIMESGVTSPPVPIETSEGDDWIYAST